MKTFDQFISERYYRPNEKLPSGKTPVQKAVNKNVSRNSNIGPNSNITRAVKHGLLITQKVKHGADNKNYNPEPNHPDVDIDAHKDKYMTVHHHPTGISYNVTKGPEGVHSIEWGHGRHGQYMRPGERVRLAKSAKHVWDNHVVTNMPPNSIIHNRPSTDTKRSTGEKRNKRAEIYQKRGGFGPMDKEGDQFGFLARPPSSKQKAKGKLQVQPKNPEDVKKSVRWQK
jgi:hypothetical protein